MQRDLNIYTKDKIRSSPESLLTFGIGCCICNLLEGVQETPKCKNCVFEILKIYKTEQNTNMRKIFAVLSSLVGLAIVLRFIHSYSSKLQRNYGKKDHITIIVICAVELTFLVNIFP